MYNLLFQIGHMESLLFLRKIFNERLSIVEVNENGTLISSWHTTDDNVKYICDFEVIGENLYLGSPSNPFLGVVKLPHDFFH